LAWHRFCLIKYTRLTEEGRLLEKEKILLIEDNKYLINQLNWALKDEYKMIPSENGDNISVLLNEDRPDFVLLDLFLPPYDSSSQKGFEILQILKESSYDGKVVIITGSQEIKDSLHAVDLGVFDYLSKPINIEELKTIIRRGLRLSGLERKSRELRRKSHKEYNFAGIIGKSIPMQSIFCFIGRIAHAEATVLIQGESGTGKELIAKALHSNSFRREGPFVTIDCGAIPSELLENELFGHEKGAFTGAISQKQGKIELGQGGTVFLDEIGDLNPALQMKLLRFIQEKEIERLGGIEKINIDARIIAATNKDLEKAIRQDIFREDLYWRLNEIAISLPPLRERGEDVLLLAEYFIGTFCEKNKIKHKVLSSKARGALIRYDWPGNVRELKHKIARAISISDDSLITEEHLELKIEDNIHYHKLKEIRELAEKKGIIKALQNNKYNITWTARELGVDRKALRRLMQRYGIKKPGARDE
jgi:two-component system NtrC family response regulator